MILEIPINRESRISGRQALVPRCGDLLRLPSGVFETNSSKRRRMEWNENEVEGKKFRRQVRMRGIGGHLVREIETNVPVGDAACSSSFFSHRPNKTQETFFFPG
eukprot:761142-Hanusia_phi.AAC.4